MKIGLVLDEFWPTAGGIATYYAMLVRLLAEAGHNVTVLLDERESGQHEVDIPGVEVVYLRNRVQRSERELADLFPADSVWAKTDLAFGLAVGDWFAECGPDSGIEVLETADTKGYGVALVDFEFPPLVAACHGSYSRRTRFGIDHGPAQRLRSAFELCLLGLCEEVTSASPKNVADWSRVLGRNVRLVTPPWYPLHVQGDSSPMPLAPTAADAPLRGVVVGRLGQEKGPVETAEACRLLLEQKVPVELRWMGRSSRTAPAERDMAEHLADQFPDVWSRTFRWDGEQPREFVQQAIAGADFLLVASLWETLNYTALEAMHAGKPVIVSEGAGVEFLAEDGVNALRVPAGDPAAIARAIAKLHEDRTLGPRLGAEGRATLGRVCAPERVVSERLAVYRAAIERRAERRQFLGMFAPVRPVIAQVQQAMEAAEWNAIERLGSGTLLWKVMGKAKRRLQQRFSWL